MENEKKNNIYIYIIISAFAKNLSATGTRGVAKWEASQMNRWMVKVESIKVGGDYKGLDILLINKIALKCKILQIYGSRVRGIYWIVTDEENCLKKFN